MQAEVEDEAVGVLLVSGHFSLVVDKPADILAHSLLLSVSLPVRRSG